MKNYKEFLKMNESWVEGINDMAKYNPMIDYTLLDNNASDEEIIQLCEKARMFEVKSVCVMPKHVKLATEQLADCGVLVCTVISFPEGTNSLQEKETETRQVVADGADEVDMVLDYTFLKDEWHEKDDLPMEKFDKMVEEIEALVDICHASKNKTGEAIILKVIVESGLLTVKQTKVATHACLDAGADFIKTSTGKVAVGAELDKIKAMYDIIEEFGEYPMKIKASGGVRDMNDLTTYGQYVDRFGMGWQSVDALNGVDAQGEGY